MVYPNTSISLSKSAALQGRTIMDLYAKSTSSTTITSSSSNNAAATTSTSTTNAKLSSASSSFTPAVSGSSSVAVIGASNQKHSSYFNYEESSYSPTTMCSCDNQNSVTVTTTVNTNSNTTNGKGRNKRRHSACSSDDSKDPEIGLDLPLAKRPTLHHSDGLPSLESSVYTSPAMDPNSAQELLSIRSSPAEEMCGASHSPLPDSPDSPPSPDRGSGAKQPPVVVPYGAQSLAVIDRADVGGADDDDDDSYDDFSYEDDDDDDDENDLDEDDDDGENDEKINSSNSTPMSTGSSSVTICNHRTPAQHLTGNAVSIMNNNNNINNNKNNNNNINKINSLDSFMASNYKCMSPSNMESSQRQCPLPALSWANAADVWQLMCKRDDEDSVRRSSTMLEQHPGLQPRMRAILLDWLIEVCEVYKLHRETFYLAVDYLDRYLHVARKVQKTHLQLIGITCLFVAAKVEEIYPPKIGEFAYVTDGACTEKDILQHEKILLQALGWDISPLTVTGWLGVYMQLNVNNRTPASFATIGQQAAAAAAATASVSSAQQSTGAKAVVDDAFIFPQFSGFEFVQTSQLLDLCTLDVGMANFSYSTLAAAALSHTFSREMALRCSGLDWHAIQPCARWMEPFFQVISKKAEYLYLGEQNEPVSNKFGLAHICPNLVTDDSHIIQTHTTTMDMYDEVLMAQEALYSMRNRTQASPATGLRAPESLLTPPASSQKPYDDLADFEETVVSSNNNSKNTTIKSSSSSSSTTATTVATTTCTGVRH